MDTQSLNTPLKIWVKEDFRLPNFRPVPLIMHLTPPDTAPELLYWNKLRDILPNLVEVCQFKDLEEAGSLVVTPNHYTDYFIARKFEPVREFNKKVLASGRRLVTFTFGMEYKGLPGETVFGQSTYRSQEDKTIPIPAWLYDLGDKVTPLAKPSIPTVGFVGNTEYPGRINSVMRYVPIPDSLVNQLAGSCTFNRNVSLRIRRVIARLVRKKTMKCLRAATNLKIHLVERNGDFFTLSAEERSRRRAEFIQSLLDNAYTVCMRGDNNDNHQMFEVMSAGRIPIIIDTNQRFPELGNQMKWEDISVIVPYAQLHRIGEIVQEFHDKMSEDGFAEVCRKSRLAYDNLMPHNFITRIVEDIKKLGV
ncbi:MAG: hypothetical protein RLZZ338_930 [Cyanobacteriota bacterium]|jgi:hypothetical protein